MLINMTNQENKVNNKKSSQNNMDYSNSMKELFDYWKYVPNIKKVDSEKNYNLVKQPVRNLIVRSLREGIEDFNPILKQNSIRYALSAIEIQQKIGGRLDSKIKLSNIYFHLEKLISTGFIVEVKTIKKGKHKVTYYGRTAKIFNLESHNQIRIAEKSLLSDIAFIQNKIDSEKGINEDFIKLLNKATEFRCKLADKWFENRLETVAFSKVPIPELFDFLISLSMFNKDIVKIYKDLADLLGITTLEL